MPFEVRVGVPIIFAFACAMACQSKKTVRAACSRKEQQACSQKQRKRKIPNIVKYQLANDRYKLRPMTRLRTFGHVVHVVHMGGLGSYVEAEVKTWGHGCDIWHVRDGQPLITGGV